MFKIQLKSNDCTSFPDNFCAWGNAWTVDLIIWVHNGWYTEVLLPYLLGRVQVLEKAYSCPRAILIQPHCLSFAVFILQVIINVLYPDTVSRTKLHFLQLFFISTSYAIFFSFCLSLKAYWILVAVLNVLILYVCSFSFVSGIAGTSLFNSVSLMAYNVFYTSIPVLTTVLDKDLSEKTVTQNPEILLYCQAGR